MPPGKQIAFEPALAEMLAQHLHHPAIMGEMDIVGLDLSIQTRSVASNTASSRFEAVSSGPKMPEIARLGVETARHREGIAPCIARRFGRRRRRGCGTVDGIVAEIRQLQFALEQTRHWRADWRPCAGRRRRKRPQIGTQAAGGVEQLLRLDSSASSASSILQMRGIAARVGDRHLMGAPEAFDLQAVDFLRAGPALRAPQHDHRPARTLDGRGRRARSSGWRRCCRAPSSSASRHQPVHQHADHRLRRTRLVAIADEEIAHLVIAHPAEHGRDWRSCSR